MKIFYTKYFDIKMDHTNTYRSKYLLDIDVDSVTWEGRQLQIQQRWLAGEVDVTKDRYQFQKMTKQQQRFVMRVLAFFALADGLLCDQIRRLMGFSKCMVEQSFFIEQMAMEAVHAEAYTNMVKGLFDFQEQDEIFDAMDDLPCVKAKGEFVKKYMEDDSLPYGLKLLAAAISEGIFFVGLFAAFFYVRTMDLLPQLCLLNEQVSKDEKLHRDVDIHLTKKHLNRDKETLNRAREMIREGVKVEIEHVRYVFQEPFDSFEADEMCGLSLESMERFILKLGDDILVSLGMEREFTRSEDDPDNGLPLEFTPPWMADISLARKDNFYEKQVTAYSTMSMRAGGKSGIDDANW